MKIILSYVFCILSLMSIGSDQIYCLIVDRDDNFNEYLGTYDCTTGVMTQISTSPVSIAANNGTTPIIDPVNCKYIYLAISPTFETEVITIDLTSGNVTNTFNFDSGLYPRHFAYDELSQTVYCLIVDPDDNFNEYLGTYDCTTGVMTQISTSPVAIAANNGTTPIIDPVNSKYIYLAISPTFETEVITIDLTSGNVTNTFNFDSGLYPRHFANSCCTDGDCEGEINGAIITYDSTCDVSGIDILVLAPDGTSIVVTTGADGTFTLPDGPFPCGDYTAAFTDPSSLPLCYTTTGSTDPIMFTVDGIDGDGPFFISNQGIPTLSQWGLISLALLLMIFGSLKLSIPILKPDFLIKDDENSTLSKGSV